MTLRVALIATLASHVMVNTTRPLLALFASSLGAGTFTIGLLAASFALLPLLLAVHLGRFTDHVGDRLPVVLGIGGVALGLALPFLLPSLWVLFVSQLIVGIGHTVAMVALQNVIGSTSTVQTRDQRFGWFAMTASTGGLLGPVVGGYLSQYFSYPVAFLCASLIGMLAIAAACWLPAGRRHKPSATEHGGTLGLLRIPALRRAMATSGLVLYSRDIFVVYFPLLGVQAGLSNSTIGWIIAAQALAIVLVRLFLGRLTQAVGRARILTLSIVLAGLAFTLIPLTEQVLLLGLLSALLGLGLGCGQPLSMATTYSAAPPERSGEALGLRMAVNRLSQLVAPLFFGAIGGWVGLLAVFYVSGGFLLGGAFLSRESRRQEGSAEEGGREPSERSTAEATKDER